MLSREDFYMIKQMRQQGAYIVDIATIHSNIVQEYNTLKGYSWKWLGGVSVAFLVMFCVLGWGMKTILDRNYNATAAVYQKVVTLEDKLVEKPVTGKSRKN